METFFLKALSPLDGRYAKKLNDLRFIFSEFGLIKFRLLVEIKWLQALDEIASVPEVKLSNESKKKLDQLIENFNEDDALVIKEIELNINHDVKAVEYFIKNKIQSDDALKKISEFIHFGCTSEDINNLAYALMMQSATHDCLLPILNNLLTALKHAAHQHASIPMLARTHGQAASPTTLGKEFANFYARLERQLKQIKNFSFLGKLNGASGNYNALLTAYPKINWVSVSKQFIEHLGLEFNPYTTQIEPHDYLAEFFSILQRINTILIDFNRDIWAYIAIEYLNQKKKENEVGSSTMPHKINPIDFENSEGNLGIANALLEHFILKLPISRWQRDLSDSTVLRNIGTALGHSIFAYQATLQGVNKLEANPGVIHQDLHNHWEVLAEAIQMVMRKHQLDQPYEQLKTFTRGQKVNKAILLKFINSLDLPNEVKQALSALTPESYTGHAEELAKKL